MKKIIGLLILINYCSIVNTLAQQVKKTATIGLHFFYNDFTTAKNIKANDFGYVVKNNLWEKPHNMEGGFGLDYMRGFTKKIDVVGTFNASWVNYLLPGNTLYGSSNFLMDINAGAHIKLLQEKRTFNPFIITKIGYTKYKNINGFSLLPGLGIQFNVFNEALIISTVEYRTALSNTLSNQLYYSIGIATGICNKNVKAPKSVKDKAVMPPAKTQDTIAAEIKMQTKDIAVTVTDEATGQPLQFVDVTLKSSDGNIYTATTNEAGKAIIQNISQGNYTISGRLNKIDASTATIVKDNFNTSGNQLQVNITHNDPRFTLVGNTVNKSANLPVGNTVVSITNSTQSTTAFAISNTTNGEFRTQLEAASDFEIVGKKAGYISNIENISTKGLNRSATLYVKLQLNIEEAKAGTTIVLNKIYFETGKATVNTSSSSDLNKLVQFLKDNPLVKLEIQGHTDNTGTLTANTKLSQLRANSIVNFLVKSGVGKERLIAKGYGSSMPIADNNTKEGKAQNRRVEMKVLE